MSSPEFRDGSPRARAPRGAARNVMLAVAERERGRRRLNATTVTVGFASVAAAGVVAVTLPGSTHAAVTSTNNPAAGTGGVSGGSTSVTGTSSARKAHAHKNTSGSASAGSRSAGSAGSSNSSNSSGNSGNLQPPASTPVQSGGGGQVTSGGTSSW
jgi:hypothetical protein